MRGTRFCAMTRRSSMQVIVERFWVMVDEGQESGTAMAGLRAARASIRRPSRTPAGFIR
ncbi:Uncharacterised protein [Bordetella pertussis]|nr:Uncharacterised protein [Bordetella pertussis]